LSGKGGEFGTGREISAMNGMNVLLIYCHTAAVWSRRLLGVPGQ